MNILLGSKNSAKKKVIDMALAKLGIQDYNVTFYRCTVKY